MIRSNRARLFAENFDARLAGIVVWPDCPLIEKVQGTSNQWKSTTFTICVQKSRGVFFLRSPKRRRQLRHSRKGLVCVHVYIYIYMHIHILQYIYIYIYIERERERERDIHEYIPALCGCVAAACGASAVSKKWRPWICWTRVLSV